MLRIIHSSPTHLILKDSRHWGTFFASLFTLISMMALLIFTSQIASTLHIRYERDGLLWMMVMVIFWGLIGGLVILGALATRHLSYGIHCEFDRHHETLVIRRIGIFRPVEIRHSIYAVAHVDTQHNPEIGMYGLFLVMKNGDRTPLASFYMVDEAEMKAVINEIRTFLRQ